VASVRHTNCITVFDFGETPDLPFFTMELFRGQPFTSLSGQAVGTILEALYHAAVAVHYIHGQGIVHRDVKPSNLLVRLRAESPATEPQVEVKLTDFGLARWSGMASSLTLDSGLLGTIQYCAPEQLDQGIIDQRADLYALGLVCYETLTGQYPYESARRRGLEALLHAKLTQAIPPLAEIAAGVPSELASAVMKLLAKAAAERPASAAELLKAAARHVRPERLHDAPARALPPAPTSPAEAIFVGREGSAAWHDVEDRYWSEARLARPSR
jgi:serine/threonine-protein kinase